MKQIILSILLVFSFETIFSQEKIESDTTVISNDSLILKKINKFFKEGHDPAKAALMSAFLPGAGQIYNKKYWKVPVVYAGLGGLGVWLGHNVVQHSAYTEAYKSFFDSDTVNTLSHNGYITETQINFKRKEFKRNLDVSAIALGVWYLLQIVDATVDAHLFEFDVNEDISIYFRPDVRMKTARSINFESGIYSGVSIQVHFK